MIPQAVISSLRNGSACYVIKGLWCFWQMRKQLIWHWGRLWWQPCGRAEPEGDWPCCPARRGAGLRHSVLPETGAPEGMLGRHLTQQSPRCQRRSEATSQSLCPSVTDQAHSNAPFQAKVELYCQQENVLSFFLMEDTCFLYSLEGGKLPPPPRSSHRALPFYCCPVLSGL